jgi:tetratricopeptide (TPR) repeat protein
MASQQLEQGRRDAAIANLRDAASAAPDLAEAHYRLGLALAGKGAGHVPEAEDALLRAVRLDPRNARYRYEWARQLLARGDDVAALDQLWQAAELAPSLVPARRELGRLALRRRDWAAAAAALRGVLAWEEGDAALHGDLATALDGLGEHEQAALEREAAKRLARSSASS